MVEDQVLKNQESIRQSSGYQNLVNRLQNEAGGDRSKVIKRRVVNSVNSDPDYVGLTDAGAYKTNADNLVGTINTFLTGTLQNMTNPTWSSLESAFNTYRDTLLVGDSDYLTLKEAGYPSETDQLIKDTLSEFKDWVWVDGEFHRSSVVKGVSDYQALIDDFPDSLADETSALATQAVDAFTVAYDAYFAAHGTAPTTWAQMKDPHFNTALAAVKSNTAYTSLVAAGYQKNVDTLLSEIEKHFSSRLAVTGTTPQQIYDEIDTVGDGTELYIATHESDFPAYDTLADQNPRTKAETLCKNILAQANVLLLGKPGSWQAFENQLRSSTTAMKAYDELKALGLDADLTALLNQIVTDTQADTYTPPSFNPPPTNAEMLNQLTGTAPGVTPVIEGSDAYNGLQIAGDKSIQPTVDQLIDNALIKYESLVNSNNTVNWEAAVRSVFTQSKAYSDADQATRAALDLIAADLISSISAELPAYSASIAITERMDEMMRTAYTSARTKMPEGQQVGSVSFINLGMRVYSMDYGSAEFIRIQNKAGDLFYHYREADSMEKVVVKADTTVQIAGQDAEISLNGAPVYTTGMIANTTTPDFAGTLVFNKGKLGLATMAVTGYDEGKIFSKATALQGVEENEPEIIELKRHFEPPAVTVSMGVAKNAKSVPPVDAAGMLDKNGQPVNLYIDFSTLDPTVQVKIRNLADPSAIKIDYDGFNINIDASSLGGPDMQGADLRVSIPVNPANLANGITVESPALKGLFVRTDVQMDVNKSAGAYEIEDSPEIQAGVGNIMLEVFTYATNPRSNTDEDLSNFIGGMQFQLGNTEGDQDRTIYSIQSMSMSELGRISYNGVEYCLQNVLGGGSASLSKNPILAMNILAKAVDDVSTLRARLGAFQSNMLQTNINNLEVAIENLTKTESAIRDTDMAEESTQFTRFQIMQQAGASMLAQANQVSQNVLSLLQ
ncbi:MAG: hypothetical protein LUE17_03250 [Planctomycetaceae bacterium]|nr:hypothetical protein [Planctomycetaceae bacterium]